MPFTSPVAGAEGRLCSFTFSCHTEGHCADLLFRFVPPPHQLCDVSVPGCLSHTDAHHIVKSPWYLVNFLPECNLGFPMPKILKIIEIQCQRDKNDMFLFSPWLATTANDLPVSYRCTVLDWLECPHLDAWEATHHPLLSHTHSGQDDRGGVAVMFAIASKGDDSAEWFVLWAPLHLFPPYKSDQG